MGAPDLPTAMIEVATAIADWVLVLPIVLALMGAGMLLVFRGRGAVPLAGAVTVVLAMIACEIVLLQRVILEGPLSMTMGRWLPPFGISLTVDMFGALFALLSAIVTLLVLVYAQAERSDADQGDYFHALVLLLLGGVTGAFLTGDLFNLYVWFEVTLIASFGLIVQGGRPLQLDAAVKYGFLNFLATTLFLLALGLLYGTLGTLNMADVLRVAPAAHPAAIGGVAALLLLAFGMKAAAFPLNGWLPAAYHTPPAAISALFAALLTKVGAYALLRSMVVVLPGSRDLLEPVLAILAVATLVIAPLGAIAETNLRRAAGFLVIGGVGAIMAGIAVPNLDGISGAGLYIVHAMLTMTGLYLTVGLVEKVTGQTDTRSMGGLYAASAPLSVLFLLSILAVAGVPPLLGFWPKLLLLEAAVGEGASGAAPTWISVALVVALLVNAVLTLIAGTRLWSHVFWRAGREGASEHQPNLLASLDRRGRWGLSAAAVVVVLGLVAGLWPAPLMTLIHEGAGDFLDPARYVAATGLAGNNP